MRSLLNVDASFGFNGDRIKGWLAKETAKSAPAVAEKNATLTMPSPNQSLRPDLAGKDFFKDWDAREAWED